MAQTGARLPAVARSWYCFNLGFVLLTPRPPPPAPQDTLLDGLDRLPRARDLPPFLGKRERELGGTTAAALAARAGGKMALDPTGLLLLQASAQLKRLAETQAQRRYLHARRSWLGDLDSDASSDAGDDCASAAGPASYDPADPLAVCSSFGAADSIQASLGTSQPSAGTSAAPGAAMVAAAAAAAVAAAAAAADAEARADAKRPRLERQYAIDLDGYCHLIGQRLPLPYPEEAQD